MPIPVSTPQMMPTSWVGILITCIMFTTVFISLWNSMAELSKMTNKQPKQEGIEPNPMLW